MPSTLVVEDGSIVAGANTYASRATADAYFDDRLHAEAWTGLSNDDKDRALLWAAKVMETEIVWYGWTVDEDQELAHPRTGLVDLHGDYVDNDTVAEGVVWCQLELALLLASEDRTLEADHIGLKSVRAGDVSVEFVRGWWRTAIGRNALAYAAPFGELRAGSGSLRVRRV